MGGPIQNNSHLLFCLSGKFIWPHSYFFSDLDIQYRAELTCDPEVDKVKVVTQCYSFIEASSNAVDIYKMTNGETVSFWQSDGSARSHWIRQA